MKWKPRGRDVLAAVSLSIAVAVGCGEGTNSFTDQSPVADGTTPLSEAAAGVPILGQLLSDCLEDGTVVFVEFIQTDAFKPILDNTQLEGITDLESLLIDDDNALGLPVLAGITPEGTISQADALAILSQQGGGVPLDTEVLGFLPVTCGDGLVPVDLALLGNYNETIGIIPIFGPIGEDGSAEIVGAVLGVLGTVNSTSPLPEGSNPIPVNFRSFDFLNGNLTGLDALGALVQSILDVLTLNL
jgi:hypothetical protein